MYLDAVICASNGMNVGAKLTSAYKHYNKDLVEKIFYIHTEKGEKLPISIPDLRDYWRGEQEDKEGGIEAESSGISLLNGLYLFRFLQKYGFAVELIYDLPREKDKLRDILEKNPSAIIVLSTTFLATMDQLKRAVNSLREINKENIIIVGGPFIYKSFKILYQYPYYEKYKSYLSHDLFNEDSDIDVNYVIFSQRGEMTLCELLSRLKKREPIDNIKNVLYKRNGKWVYTGFREEKSVDMEEEVAILDWENIPEEYLHKRVAIRGSIGCPYRCKFCNLPFFVPKFRWKSMETLIKEVKAISSRKIVRDIFFVDDNLFFSSERLADFSKGVIKEKIPLTYTSFIRANIIRRVDNRLLKEAGFRAFNIGVESGDERILKNMQKLDTVENHRVSIEHINKLGINAYLTFIIGFPGETNETIENTFSFMNSLCDLDNSINVSIPFPFLLNPLSPISEPSERAKYGLEGMYYDWRHNTMDSEEALMMTFEAIYKVKYSLPLFKDNDPYFIHQRYKWSYNHIKGICKLISEIIRLQVREPLEIAKKEELIGKLKSLVMT
ncbi:MAG: B12-binding domain-containing radical SAM protein [Candidatus Omnitrophica bacterium]|nr:B12-binding domain-containing radical SAM protein [Candidatus Omnitrophota bacterium]